MTCWWDELRRRREEWDREEQEEREREGLWFWEECEGIYDNDGDLLIASLLFVGVQSLQESIYMSFCYTSGFLRNAIEEME